jgi:hypothetical protein
MNHDPKTASQTKKATFAGDLDSFGKLRGKDLNLRPLGYEDCFIVSRVVFSTVYVLYHGGFLLVFLPLLSTEVSTRLTTN